LKKYLFLILILIPNICHAVPAVSCYQALSPWGVTIIGNQIQVFNFVDSSAQPGTTTPTWVPQGLSSGSAVPTQVPYNPYPTQVPYVAYPTQIPYLPYPTQLPAPTQVPYNSYPTQVPYTAYSVYPTQVPYSPYPTQVPYNAYPTQVPYAAYPAYNTYNPYPTAVPYNAYPTQLPHLTQIPYNAYPTQVPYTAYNAYPTQVPYSAYPAYNAYPTQVPYTAYNAYPTQIPYSAYPTQVPYLPYPTQVPYSAYPTAIPVTAWPTQIPVFPNYNVSASNTVSVTGSAVTAGSVTYLMNRWNLGSSIIGGSGAVDFAWYGSINPNGNSFVSWGAVTLSGANATTYFSIPTPSYSMMVSCFTTSASTTITHVLRGTQ
jgi:hypothetical protein